MKKTFLKISCLLLIATFVVVSCKKKDDTTTTSASAEQTTGSDDSKVQSESDAVVNESDAALSSNSSTMRTSSGSTSLCGVSVDSSQKASGILVLNYNGLDCSGNRNRSGSITLHLTGGTWNTTGATVSLTFNNYTVTRTGGKTLVFTGTKYIKNVNGGLAATLAAGSGSVTHKIQSTNMQVKFDDGTSRTWGISRTRTITRQTATGFTVSTVGDSSVTINSVLYNNVAMAGTTRLGTPFCTIISSPVVWNTGQCTSGPVSGTRTIQGLDHALTITYGVDQTGHPVTNGCPYGALVSWLAGTKTAIVSY